MSSKVMRELLDLMEGNTIANHTKQLNESVAEILDEDLGTLQQVDTEFLPLFKIGGRWKSGQHVGGKLRHGLTSESPVEVIGVPSAVGATKVFAENRNVMGLIIRVAGEQVIAFSKHEGYRYNTVVQAKFKEKAVADLAAKAGTKLDIYNSPLKHNYPSDNQVKAMVAFLLRFTKAINAPVDALIIKFDDSKKEIRAARKAAKEGSPHFIKDLTAYLRKDLRARLDKFKADKAETVDSLDAAFERFKDNFLDKINIGGYTYEITNTNLNWTALRNPKTDDLWYRSYITYRIDAPGRKKARAEIEAWEAADPENNKYGSETWKEFSKTLPVDRFEVEVKLVGNVLTPVKLNVENGIGYY